MLGTKTLGGLVATVLAVMVLVQTGIVGQIWDAAGERLEELTGGGELVTAPDVRQRLEQCRPGQAVSDEECDGLKFVVLDAKKMPYIGLNISTAWTEGKPGILTRGGNETIKRNRGLACAASFVRQYGGSCDEYPFASAVEGGTGARSAEVPRRENSCQGGSLNAEYKRKGIAVGDAFGVMLKNPESIAAGPFTGPETGEETTCS